MPETTAYRFANAIWVENWIGSRLNWGSIAKGAVFSAAPWFIGLIIAALSGVGIQYLQTPGFYVGSVGIFIAIIGLVNGASQQYEMYDRLVSAFELEHSKSRAHVLSALSRHSSFWQHLRATVIIFLIGFCSIVASVLMWGEIGRVSDLLNTNLPRFKAFEDHNWYANNIKICTFLILFQFLIFIASVLGTSASIMLRLPVFLWRLSGERPKLPPAVIKAQFSPAATVYSITSLFWIFGVGLMLYFVGPNKDWLSYSLIAFVFIVGIVNLAVPQLAYIRTVTAAEEIYTDIISERFGVVASGSGVLELNAREEHRNVGTSTLLLLLKFEDWVYPVHQTYVVVGVYLASVIGTAVGWKKIFELFTEGLS